MDKFSMHRTPRADADESMTVHALARTRPVNKYVAVRAPANRFRVRNDELLDKIDAKLVPHLCVYRGPFSVPLAIGIDGSEVGYYKLEVTEPKFVAFTIKVPRGTNDATLRQCFVAEWARCDAEFRAHGFCVDHESTEWSFDHMVFEE